MNWDSDDLRAAALQLLTSGTISLTRVSRPLLAELEELGLVAPDERPNRYRMPAHCKERVRHYVRVRWSGLDSAEAAFASCPQAIDASALRAARRALLAMPEGLGRLNRKTWSSWAGAHSKSQFRAVSDGVQLTTDDVLRLRANAGLRIVAPDGTALLGDACLALFGEMIIPERGFDCSWQLDGVMPRLVLTVENLGAYIDLALPPEVLAVHAPGRNTGLATRFIDRLPPDIPWLHFGDLDPAGLAIATSIHTPGRGKRATPWIPVCAAEVLETHALPLHRPWPTSTLPSNLLKNPILARLIERKQWLEHEAIVLLGSFETELFLLSKQPRLD